ncbi:MAG: serine/threonine protein kinase [Deltaproteobacteria bacterium]|nr:serine/threonine protein kinase [Deltaproteobacteria bacterium]
MKVFHHSSEISETPLREFQDSYHFQLTRKIAEGGMGVVYEAKLFGAEGFEKQVAIKTIRQEIAEMKDFVQLFIGEAKLAACLVHQNIVQIYRLGMVDNIYYVAMEYVRGVDLRDFIWRHFEREEKIPIELAAFIASRVARGLEYAHRKTDGQGRPLNAVHCDISPKNLMISAEGEVKITDFGIAKAKGIIRGDLLEGLGKASYVSPEQIEGGVVDGRSDIFSLGAVLYEMLTGQRAFKGKNREEILENVLHKPITTVRGLNGDVPKDLENIILRCLKIKQEERYVTAGELGYDLEYLLYHGGYGPTIQTLQKHVQKLFPEIYLAHLVTPSRDQVVMPGDLSLSLSLADQKKS